MIVWLGGGGGGRKKFLGAREVYLCVNSRGARGHEKFIPVWITWTRWEAKIQKGFSGWNRKFKRFFRPKTGDFQKKKKKRSSPNLQGIFRPISGNSSGFSGRKQVISKKKNKKKNVFSKFARDFPAKIGNLSDFSGRNQVVSKKKKKQKKVFIPKRHEIRCQSTKNTNLGLDLHSSSPEPVNFSGAQSLLGGHKQSFGGYGPGMPPVAPGSELNQHFRL